MRRNAANWLRLADKVYHYRHDLLKDSELQDLVGARNQLQESLRRNEDASKLKLGVERLEDVLRKHGGPYYRRSGWTENVEVLLVAAILAIGVRTYFVQPFKIPTNSMWPSYYGMTAEVYSEGDEPPGAIGSLFRRLAFGAKRYTVDAPVSGEVQLAIHIPRQMPVSARLPREPVTGKKWLIVPTPLYRYSFYVGDTPVAVDVPADFQMEPVFHEAFFPDAPSLEAAISEALMNHRPRPGEIMRIGTGIQVEAGEPALEFDLLTGDQLFVDRFSYHFVRPKVGDGFVFRTGSIPELSREPDKYYIKRLVGVEGDVLEIKNPPVLLRNGERIDGQPVFEKIQSRDGLYTGYVAGGLLAPGRTVEVPEDRFFAMGDNSSNSLDSRSWGFVPADAVVGRSLFIYYPFTSRWGPAR